MDFSKQADFGEIKTKDEKGSKREVVGCSLA